MHVPPAFVRQGGRRDLCTGSENPAAVLEIEEGDAEVGANDRCKCFTMVNFITGIIVVSFLGAIVLLAVDAITTELQS